MLSWIERILGEIGGAVSAAVRSAISAVVGALASLLSALFGGIKGAWLLLADAGRLIEHAAQAFGEAVWSQLRVVIEHLIPRYAMTAWWWVTHPQQLAEVLMWWVLHWLEREAWTAGLYLGEFTLALIRRNVRRVALLAETIIHAVL